MRRFLTLTVFGFSLLTSSLALAAPLPVVTSFSILGDLTQQIGGDKVAVTNLVDVDGDAHVFEPTPNDAKKVTHAALVIMNGLGFEGWMERLTKAANYKGKVVVASDGLKNPLEVEEEGEEHEHGHHHHGAQDPHAWQDITNTRLYVKNIAAALSAKDPANAAVYNVNAVKLDAELVALDTWVKAQIDTVPPEKRQVITSHDAFGYFARAYGVKFLAPVGLNTEDEPSAKEMRLLITQLKTGKVKALFLENMANPAVVEQIGKEAKVVMGGKLYADALSAKDGAAGSYQQMIRYNVGELVRGMGVK
jgi:zinc/manganese transport system substrate-binding protein